MPADRYSNADIMDKLLGLSLHLESAKTDLAVVKEQVLKTNGRVNTIEQWMNGIQAIEQYKKENPTQKISANTVVVQSAKWFQNEKLVGGVVAVLLAVAAALGFVFAGVTH